MKTVGFPPVVVGGTGGDGEVGFCVGVEFGTERGNGEVVEGREAGGGRHAVGGEFEKRVVDIAGACRNENATCPQTPRL